MRGHLSALTEAMRRLSDGDYEGAALLTETHYALIPDTAEYCEERMFTKEESIAAARLPPAAPDPLPQMFNAMHDAARAFAAEARRAKLSGDSTVAWKALAAMSTYCDACHAGYRLE